MASPVTARHTARRHEQLQQVQHQDGFFVALDQSKGSTPKALRLYGIGVHDYFGEADMFEKAHEMRSRIIESDVFDGARGVVGVVLYEDTVEREIANLPAATYLWEEKQVVSFLKIDRGVMQERHGVQLMKDIPDLDDLLDIAVNCGVLGTKARSVVRVADLMSIKVLVRQQFDLAKRVLARGLLPILECEVDIHSPDKGACEAMLLDALLEALKTLGPEDRVMFRLTIPSEPDFYQPMVAHPSVLRVLALSGGHSLSQACGKLAKNPGMAACFSRAFHEGLSVNQFDEEFTESLSATAQAMYRASVDDQTQS